MMGGLRASSQMMSYEVTMGMAVLGSFLVYGTLEPGAIVAQQTSILDFGDIAHSWGIFSQPLGFLLFLTAAIAETKRTPFDIPEGEPEIIGYFVEYSGLRFGMFFLGEFLGDRLLERHHDHAVLRRLALGRSAGHDAGGAPAELRLRAGHVRRCGPRRCSCSARSSC